MIIDETNYKEFLGEDGTILVCTNKGITEIRYLPDNLEKLYCENNQLTELPKLPNSLLDLFCFNNQLTELPELPNSLKVLFCDGNQLILGGKYNNKTEISEFKKQYQIKNKLSEFLA